MAQGGLSVPTYAYGLNNPLRYADKNGLWTIQVGFGGAAGVMVGVEGQGGIFIDGEGNAGTFESVGFLSGMFVTLGTGLTVAWSEADNIYQLEGWGVEAGAMLGPVTSGWSGSGHPSHINECASMSPPPGMALPPYCPSCNRAGGDAQYIDGAFISGGGEGLGLGGYIGATHTWVQRLGSWW